MGNSHSIPSKSWRKTERGGEGRNYCFFVSQREERRRSFKAEFEQHWIWNSMAQRKNIKDVTFWMKPVSIERNITDPLQGHFFSNSKTWLFVLRRTSKVWKFSMFTIDRHIDGKTQRKSEFSFTEDSVSLLYHRIIKILAFSLLQPNMK